MPYDLSGIFPAIAKIAGKDKVTGGPAFEDILDPQTGQVVRKWKMDPYQGSSGFLGIASRNRAQALNDAIMPELAMQQQRIASAKELENQRAANELAQLDTRNTYVTTGRNELAGLQRELEKLKSRLTNKETAFKSDVQNIGKTGALINKKNKRQYAQADQSRVDASNRQAQLENLSLMGPEIDAAYKAARMAELKKPLLNNLVRLQNGETVFNTDPNLDFSKGDTLTGAVDMETVVPPSYDKSGKITNFGGKQQVRYPATITPTQINPASAAAVLGQTSPEQPTQSLFPMAPASPSLNFDPYLASAMFGSQQQPVIPQQQTAPIPAAQQNTNGVPVPSSNTFTNAGWNADPIARQAAAQAAAAQNRKALLNFFNEYTARAKNLQTEEQMNPALSLLWSALGFGGK
jgi:hypothetical protein